MQFHILTISEVHQLPMAPVQLTINQSQFAEANVMHTRNLSDADSSLS